jgi:glycosyltransferase involved in cell wall biosynthesis
LGGLERIIGHLARGLDRTRFNVVVHCLNKKGYHADQLEKEGYTVYLPSQQGKIASYMRGLTVRGALVRESIDILHSHNTAAFLDGVVGAKLANTPVIIHTDHVRKFPDKRRYMAAERIASYFVDEIVAVSRHVREALIEYEGIRPDKISIIYNGVDFSPAQDGNEIKAVRDEFNVTQGEKVVGCVARLAQQKGYELFMEAARRILRKTQAVKFVVVGVGEEYDRLLKLCSELGIRSKVHFAGARTDIERVLPVFDIFLLTSHYEGMPVCLLESMVSGVPIVATAVGGVPEAVQDGISGYLIHSRDPDEVAEKVVRLLRNDNLRLKMGKNGRQIYENRFTIERMAEQYTELYESYLSVRGLL